MHRTITLVGLAMLLTIPAIRADSQAKPSKAQKIANAMTAAPAAVSRNAAVAEMNQDGSMKELRKGTNGWTCVPDDPSSPGQRSDVSRPECNGMAARLSQ